MYNLTGGLAILFLTKLGGLLFDKTTTAAPFLIVAAFNALMFTICVLHILISKGSVVRRIP